MSAETVPEKKIAVIGPTQSGKTCLAVGLASTNISDLTIHPVEQEVYEYVESLKIGFAKGNWPDPTNRGTKKEIRLDFLKKGKDPIRVLFPEFAGELLASDEVFRGFANKHFKNLAGVVLLLNPASEAFKSGNLRLLSDVMSQYKRVLNFLRDENNLSRDAFIALTITAADRIKGDLAGQLESFSQSVEELGNTLETSGFTWRRFDVTVTGRLKDLDRPTIARGRKNSAAAPFLWILDELNWRPQRQALFRKIRRIAFVVASLAVLAGVWLCVDAWNDINEIHRIESDLNKEIEKCNNLERASKGDCGEVKRIFSKLQNRKGWFSERAADIARETEPRVWGVYEKVIRHEESAIACAPEKHGGDCQRVDNLFSDWHPSVREVKDKYDELKQKWDKNKPGYEDKYAVNKMLEDIHKPLLENAGLHGKGAFSLLAGLYGKLATITPTAAESKETKEKISQELDARAEKEWREFAIPDFANHAATNATHEATREFVDGLKSWIPVTTNAVSAKEALFAQVTNSVPRWRTAYETTTFEHKIDEAVKSAVLEDLAVLYPQRVMERGETNDYLTVAYVATNWVERVEKEFSQAVAMFEKEILASIMRRRGRPNIVDSDIDQVEARGSSVGAPFDAGQIITNLKASVAKEAIKWESSKRKECTDWVNDNVSAGRKRIGQGGLWDDYEKFSNRCSADNPFIDELVRPAVYAQVERWLEDDVSAFRKLDCHDEHYEKDAEELFDGFNRLCRRLDEDKNPLRTSWAWHFARDCCAKAKTDRIGECFPRELSVTKVEGLIDYDDFRNTYNGTDLTACIVIKPLGGEFKERPLVLAQTLGKDGNKSWQPIQYRDMKIRFHPFDVLTIKLKANDKITFGRNLECDVKEMLMTGICLNDKDIPIEIGGEFDLRKATKFVGKGEWWQGRLTTKDPTPDAFIKIYGTLSGDSIEDYVVKAKRDAELEKQAK